jgi:hypothetical protein
MTDNEVPVLKKECKSNETDGKGIGVGEGK